MSDNSTNGHIDYREAFVIDMEMAAHGPGCKQCVFAAIDGKQEAFCERMLHMRAVIKRAYEALPTYYKDRYTVALDTAVKANAEAIKSVGR